MTLNRMALMLTAALLAAPGAALAQDAISAPAQKAIGQAKPKMVPSLIVLNSKGAILEGDMLTLDGVSPNAIMFADRPVRAAGHALTAHLLEEWGEGSDSFAKDPPNATVSALKSDASTVMDAVVVLKSPKLEGDKLTFTVEVLEGSLEGADGPASIFIDNWGYSYGNTAETATGSASRTAWYAGAPPWHGGATSYSAGSTWYTGQADPSGAY